jgi:hypothetical protein
MATFDIYTARNHYNFEEARKLEELGFQFRETGIDLPNGKNSHFMFYGQPAPKIEINNMEQLENFGKEYGPLTIDFEEETIEILDDRV